MLYFCNLPLYLWAWSLLYCFNIQLKDLIWSTKKKLKDLLYFIDLYFTLLEVVLKYFYYICLCN